MSLRSVYLLALVALGALVATVWAEPSDPNCEELLKPLSLADHSVMSGSAKLLLSYTDNETFKAMMKVTEGSSFNMTHVNDHAELSEDLKINGSCFHMTMNMTINGDTFAVSVMNVSSVYNLLPTCKGCFAISGNSTARNLKKVFEFMKIDLDTEDVVEARAIYFYGNDENLKDEDQKSFREQAKCLGFPEDPVFQYEPNKGFCKVGESIKISE